MKPEWFIPNSEYLCHRLDNKVWVDGIVTEIWIFLYQFHFEKLNSAYEDLSPLGTDKDKFVNYCELKCFKREFAVIENYFGSLFKYKRISVDRIGDYQLDVWVGKVENTEYWIKIKGADQGIFHVSMKVSRASS